MLLWMARKLLRHSIKVGEIVSYLNKLDSICKVFECHNIIFILPQKLVSTSTYTVFIVRPKMFSISIFIVLIVPRWMFSHSTYTVFMVSEKLFSISRYKVFMRRCFLQA